MSVTNKQKCGTSSGIKTNPSPLLMSLCLRQSMLAQVDKMFVNTVKQICTKETIRMLPNRLPSTIVSFTPAGQRYEIDLSENRPESFASQQIREQYERAVYINATRMKRDIEIGQFFPTVLDTKFEEDFAESMNVYEEEVKEYFASLNTEDFQGDTKYKFLYIESQLTEFDACVKLKLRDSLDECLNKANELLKLDFEPLMFKKNPQVVETIRKVSNICGSQKNAPVAKALYNKLKKTFSIPDDTDFESYFDIQIREFKNKYKDLNSIQLRLLTSDS